MNSLVSVITPSYNSERFINDCVYSVLKQTYNNWELLIVDDASEDNSRKIIKELSKVDERIKSIFLEKMLVLQMLEIWLLKNLKEDILHFWMLMIFGKMIS
jgi:glycosyltransferase involved in cell wall biosynthesis